MFPSPVGGRGVRGEGRARGGKFVIEIGEPLRGADVFPAAGEIFASRLALKHRCTQEGGEPGLGKEGDAGEQFRAVTADAGKGEE